MLRLFAYTSQAVEQKALAASKKTALNKAVKNSKAIVETKGLFASKKNITESDTTTSQHLAPWCLRLSVDELRVVLSIQLSAQTKFSGMAMNLSKVQLDRNHTHIIWGKTPSGKLALSFPSSSMVCFSCSSLSLSSDVSYV